MSASTTCPTCGYTIQSGQEECPNCGTVISQNLVDEILPAPVEPVKKAARKPAPKKTGAISLKPYREMLAEAQQKEESGDLAGALGVYRRALAFVEANRKADRSLELAMQTLSLLIQRTEQLLARQTASRDLADVPAVEPVPVPEVAPLVEPPAEPEVISANEVPGVPETTPLPLAGSVKEEESPRDPDDTPWLLSDSPPPPSRSKFDRKTIIFIRLGGAILLGLSCLVIGLALTGGDLSKLSFYSTPTPSYTPSYTPTPPWEVNIYDSFNSNEYSWPNIDNTSYSCGIENMHIQNGKLVWDLTNSTDCFWWEMPETGELSDFSYSVDVQRVSGSSDSDYGIVFREQELTTHYFFNIADDNQTYAFFVYQQDSWTTLISWTSSTAIRPGDVNRIGVVARGPDFQFYINGTMVATFTDYSLSSGSVGVAAEPRGSGTELILEFDNFELNGNP